VRILVANPNTSAAVTALVERAIRRVASPRSEFLFVTGSFGAKVVSSWSENAIAAHSAVDLVSTHAKGCDGIILAISFDSGLRAARELSGLPTLGITEAALLAASTLGVRIGLVVLSSRAKTLYRDLVCSYGLGDRLCGIRALDGEGEYDERRGGYGEEELTAAARALIELDGAEIVILVGAVFGGRSLDIERRLPVPILDGLRCAAPMIEALIDIRAPGASTEAGRDRSDRLVTP
jgi:allantoin racemase